MRDTQIRFINAHAFAIRSVLPCLEIVKNIRIFLFISPRVDDDRLHKAHIVKIVGLLTVPTKADTALVFPPMHVYNTHTIPTHSHNVTHFFIYLFIYFFCKILVACGLRNTRGRKIVARNLHTLSFPLARVCTLAKRNSTHMSTHICADLHSGTPYYNKKKNFRSRSCE